MINSNPSPSIKIAILWNAVQRNRLNEDPSTHIHWQNTQKTHSSYTKAILNQGIVSFSDFAKGRDWKKTSNKERIWLIPACCRWCSDNFQFSLSLNISSSSFHLFSFFFFLVHSFSPLLDRYIQLLRNSILKCRLYSIQCVCFFLQFIVCNDLISTEFKSPTHNESAQNVTYYLFIWFQWLFILMYWHKSFFQ